MKIYSTLIAFRSLLDAGFALISSQMSEDSNWTMGLFFQGQDEEGLPLLLRYMSLKIYTSKFSRLILIQLM